MIEKQYRFSYDTHHVYRFVLLVSHGRYAIQ